MKKCDASNRRAVEVLIQCKLQQRAGGDNGQLRQFLLEPAEL